MQTGRSVSVSLKAMHYTHKTRLGGNNLVIQRMYLELSIDWRRPTNGEFAFEMRFVTRENKSPPSLHFISTICVINLLDADDDSTDASIRVNGMLVLP